MRIGPIWRRYGRFGSDYYTSPNFRGDAEKTRREDTQTRTVTPGVCPGRIGFEDHRASVPLSLGPEVLDRVDDARPAALVTPPVDEDVRAAAAVRALERGPARHVRSRSRPQLGQLAGSSANGCAAAAAQRRHATGGMSRMAAI